MSEIDKVAREFLSAEYSKIGNTFRSDDIRKGRVNSDEHLAINAIRAALLTAPPGWKLVPVEPMGEMVSAVLGMDYPDHASEIYSAMLNAAPELKA